LGRTAALKLGTTASCHDSSGGPTARWHLLRVCDTFLVMPERSFAILRYDGNVPTMACCGKCQHKFFTPSDFRPDPAGAEQYLRDKFVMHKCREEPKK
jgi:hypothetical protein